MTINQRIVELIDFLKTNQRQFALAVGTSSGRINNIVKGRNAPDSELLTSILTAYRNVSARWLMTGEGNIISSLSSYRTGYHSFIPASALPGYATTLQESSPSPPLYIKIPGAPPGAITFEVPTDIMLPMLCPTDYVTCIRDDDIAHIEPQHIYVIITPEAVHFSYLQVDSYSLVLRRPGSSARTTRIAITDVRELWRVILRTTSYLAPLPAPFTDDRLARLEAFIAQHFPDWGQ